MKTVKVYIETTITGPSKPKYGKYAAALAFTRKNGKTEDRFLQGSEQETTYNRSVLLAMVRANRTGRNFTDRSIRKKNRLHQCNRRKRREKSRR